jgi:membrane protease YdiL (CAAX protease family)
VGTLASRIRAAADRALPPSPVGAGLTVGASTRAAAAGVALAVVLVDLLRFTGADSDHAARLLAPLAGLAVLALLARGRDPAATLALVPRPRPSGRFWVAAALLLAAVFAVGVFGLLWALGAADARLRFPLLVHRWDGVPATAMRLLVVAPLLEEAVYRGVLVPALVPALGRWGALVASGLAFAGIHHVYGNAGPDNQVAGFVLAWAMLRSGTLWMPVALHAGGNALVLVLHAALGPGGWRPAGVLPY